MCIGVVGVQADRNPLGSGLSKQNDFPVVPQLQCLILYFTPNVKNNFSKLQKD
jgi:hypothetical protein